MKRTDLIESVANDAQISKLSAGLAIKGLVSAIQNTLAAGGKVSVPGLGIFLAKPRKPRVGRNLKTGERIEIPAGKKVSFKPATTLRRAVKGEK